MWAIVDIHDYIMFFVINIFVIVVFFTIIALYFQQKYMNNLSILKNFINWNIEDHSHAPFMEFYWTFIPIILLFLMGWPSFHVLYAMEQLIDPFHTIMIFGNQWFRSYEYADIDIVSDLIYQIDKVEELNSFKNKAVKKGVFFFSNYEEVYLNFKNKNFIHLFSKCLRDDESSKFFYDCLIIPEENLPIGYPRLLSTDQILILPNNISIRLLVTSSDVIHSWALPSLGIKIDAIPGRLNQLAFICPFWGTYRGQCSELCGINHGFMPIEIKILSFADYLHFLQLNVSFRYENVFLLLKKLLIFFLEQIHYNIESNKYIFSFSNLVNFDLYFCKKNFLKIISY